MPLKPVLGTAAITLLEAAFTTAVLMMASSAAHGAEPELTTTLCDVLKKLVPELKGYRPDGARAQFVMAVAEKFDYDAVRLRDVRAQIDLVTSGACPQEREGLLGILRVKSLAEAIG